MQDLRAKNTSRLELLSEVQDFSAEYKAALSGGIVDPYSVAHAGRAGATVKSLDGRELIHLAGYNYVGLSGHPEVNQAAVEAVETYGTSVSASRLVAGEIPLHGQLEEELAEFLGVEAVLVMVSGYGTNATLIPHLMGPDDLVVHDALIHASALRGAQASGAECRPFRHSDMKSLDKILSKRRSRYKRVMVLAEGLYSMDGDVPDLAALQELQEKYDFLLMVDEAHSLGSVGATGRGLCEHHDLPRSQQVIWMGTLSKSLASCGGFLGGTEEFIRYLRFTLPGFVYSVGMPPAQVAAALAALRILKREPERVTQVQENSRLFGELLREGGCDTGLSREFPVIPVMIDGMRATLAIKNELFQRGINASAIVYPAVPRGQSRLRFFVSQEHSEEQLRRAAAEVIEVVQELNGSDPA